MHSKRSTPMPAPRQRWRLELQETEIVRILPGGGGGLGIAEFDGYVPPAHVSTMLKFPCWSFVAPPPEPHLPDIDVGDGCPVGVR